MHMLSVHQHLLANPIDVLATWPGGREMAILPGNQEKDFYYHCKRFVDFLLASLLLILLSPLLVLIALLIKLDSRGPFIFRQERVGSRCRKFGGKTIWVVKSFTFYKFRSMFSDVDTSVHEAYIRAFVEGRASASDQSGGKFKLTNDSRVTRIGRILRKTSLDELPQLFNVLKGDMSLVGPRPVPLYEAALYRGGEHWRLAALPGITGLWQVAGRCVVPFAEMIQMDLEYIRKASLWLDAKILLRTIPAVFSARGAE